VLRAGFSGRG